jgi:ABC-type multidrug transport system ATPase subunit
MWRERGLTMVLVTHDSSIARRAQRIGVMKNGRLGFKQPRPGQAARFQAPRAGGSLSTGTPADLEPPRLQAPDLGALKGSDLDSEVDEAHLDSELPDFDDPDSERADTVTFD